jgi:hypothetical protein
MGTQATPLPGGSEVSLVNDDTMGEKDPLLARLR